MTDEEILICCKRRIAGATWAEIAEELHYTKQRCYACTRDTIMGTKYRRVQLYCMYPNIADVIGKRYGNNLSAFSRALGLPSTSVRATLYGHSPMTCKMVQEVERVTGLTREQILEKREAEDDVPL